MLGVSEILSSVCRRMLLRAVRAQQVILKAKSLMFNYEMIHKFATQNMCLGLP